MVGRPAAALVGGMLVAVDALYIMLWVMEPYGLYCGGIMEPGGAVVLVGDTCCE